MAENSTDAASKPRTITRELLTRDLTRLGVRKGDCVMLHSSLSSLGWVEGGAATVVEAFLDAMGPEGTLLTPAFTGGAWTEHMALPDCRGVCPQDFCPSRWASREGAIPNAALQRPGCLRGCHPTHSWIANGARCQEALRGQRECPTPCGRGNPFEKVVEWDGCIVILGVGVDTITLWHYYEDLLEVDYLGYYHPEARHLSYCATGKRIQYDFPGIMQDVVRASGIMTTGRVGRSESGLIRARVFRRFMATIMADDPDCFVLRPADATNGDLATDALAKGAAMLRAWRQGPAELPGRIEHPQDSDDVVREDCPSFAGYHEAAGRQWSLCRANDRHPELHHHGGIFDRLGKTCCGRCSWHLRFPRR